MKLCKYGITLKRITPEDIEFVWGKSNQADVNHFPGFNVEIAPGMLQTWFESINNFETFYYIIEYKGVRLGLLTEIKLNWKARTSESNLFIWDESYIGTIVPLLAFLCLLEVRFYYLNWKTTYIRVSGDKPGEVEFAGKLGYALTANQENAQNQLYYLTRELLETKGEKIRKEAHAYLEEESGEGYILLEPSDYESGIAQKIEKYFTEEGINLHRKGIAGSRKYFSERLK
jgi:hypothetical protein